MARQHGIVLTYVERLDQLEDCVRQGGYDTVKLVTGWGVDAAGGGWSPANMRRALGLAPHVIVRTVAGDPSSAPPPASGSGANDFPDPDRIEAEIAPWYAIRPDITIEIGNEPNARYGGDERFIWKWRYFLAAAVARCRQKFPRAALMPGGLMYGKHQPRRFVELMHDVMATCDAIAIHAYEFYSFAPGAPASTGQLREALDVCAEFFPDKDWYLTEYGINDRTTIDSLERGRRYAGMVHFDESDPALPANLRGAVYYHLAMRGDADQQAYQLYPQGEQGYRARFGASFPPPAAPPLRPAAAPPAPAYAPLAPAAPLVGPASGPIERAVAYVRANLKPGSEYANDVEVIMGYYWKYAPAVGLDPFLAACQCIFETDSLGSQWAARPKRNPAGLGVREGQGLSFASWEVSVQAHLGRLLALALADAAATEAQRAMMAADPLHAGIPAASRGAAPTAAALGGVWSPNPDYGKNLVARANQVLGV